MHRLGPVLYPVGSVSSVASCSASVAPSGRTGRTYSSGMCSHDEPEGRCITAGGGDAKNSFAIVAIYCVLKERVFLVYFSIGQFSSVRAFIPTGYEPGLALGFWKVTRNHHCRQYVERGKL